MATRLFVGNLPDNTAEDDLHTAFASYGQITNLELKSKSATGNEKKFAFVTISGSNYDIETCIKHFSNEDFNGNKLYVTRARESFLERLQRERLEAQQKEAEKVEGLNVATKIPELKLGDKLNPRKRKIEEPVSYNRELNNRTSESYVQYDDRSDMPRKTTEMYKTRYDKQLTENTEKKEIRNIGPRLNATSTDLFCDTNSYHNGNVKISDKTEMSKKKQDSDHKRIEAMKKKSQEFKQKKMILKSGLTDVDKVQNKKIVFSDNEDDSKTINGYEKIFSKNAHEKKNTLFENDDDDDSGDELNFEIKKQFEGKKGQKVLDLQSRYKSDKRFVLDERFIEDEAEAEKERESIEEDNRIELNQVDEKAKQLNILEDVLGVTIRKRVPDEERDGKKNKPKLGMLRFDPTQPEHAKFLAPVEDTKQESTKKTKKKKDKQLEAEVPEQPRPEEPRPEVSKDQFYKVSDTLKEAIAQSTTFSLRSLFGNTEPTEKESAEVDYTPLEPPKKPKIKNPLQPGEKNPFVYDSSDSETEEIEKETSAVSAPSVPESKAVWKESFFFGLTDQRLKDGLDFFTNSNEPEVHKERRELKSLMKKRIYNKERKDQMQMFRKKIGGRKKTMKKSFKRKN